MLLTLALALAATATNGTSAPRLLEGKVSETEYRGILKALGHSPAPLAIRVGGSQTLPYYLHATLFLAPTGPASRAGVVRGGVVYLKCPTEPRTECTADWQEDEAPARWALLSSTVDAVRAGSGDPPFELHGEFSDAELLSLVAYVRTSPAPDAPPGSVALGIRGDWEIASIGRNDDGTVYVAQRRGDIGQHGKFKKTRRGWKIVEAAKGRG
jgi:hypothetical protein